MSTLRFRASASDCPAALVAKLRHWTNLSIAEIRQRVATGDVLWEFEPFQNDWQETRQKLVAITQAIESGNLPLSAGIFFEGHEEPISIDVLKNKIQFYRQIELETQCTKMLENGEIDDPSEFSPHIDDWTRGA